MPTLLRIGRPGPQTTVQEAKLWLHTKLSKGADCPCCGNYTRVYPRVLNSGMARALIVIYRSFGRDFGDLPALLMAHRDRRPLHPLGGEEPKLRYWGLLEEDPTREAYYRVTDAGEDWVLGYTHVPKYALVMTTQGRCVGLDGPPWSIRNALGKKFDLVELLNEAPFSIPATALMTEAGNGAYPPGTCGYASERIERWRQRKSNVINIRDRRKGRADG